LQNTREFSGYIYPQQNGFSSPLSWRSQTYKMEDGRYKEEEGIVPTSPNTPPSFPRVKNRVPNCQRCIPFEKTRRNRLKLLHQHRCRSALSMHHSTSKKRVSITAQRQLLALSAKKC